MERKNSLFGAPSLLVIFGVLFLTILALLTVTRMNTGRTASRLTAEQTLRRYAVQVQAEEILAAIREGKIPEGVTEADGVYRYACPISETQRWEYAVTVMPDGTYTAKRRLVTTVPTRTEDTIDVWDGNFEPGEAYE